MRTIPRSRRRQPGFDTPIPPAVQEQIRARLKAAGVNSCENWRDLEPVKRNGIWGITKSTRFEIDAIVTAALERGRK